MQNIIDKFLVVNCFPIIGDIQREFKIFIFNRYLLDMVKILIKKGDMFPKHTAAPVKNIDAMDLMSKLLKIFQIERKMTLNGRRMQARCIQRGLYYISLSACVNECRIDMCGNVVLKYSENSSISLPLYPKMGDVWELVMHQSKFFRTFMERFEGYDEIKYQEEAPKFVEEFPIL